MPNNRWKQVNLIIKKISCDFIIICDFSNGKEKKGILLTSRVHPGESMVSYVIEYIIDFIAGNSMEARILRENFIFKIVPMLNIDGVLNGNYRCNLAGVDLNRQWIDPSRKLHPTIFNTKYVILYYFLNFPPPTPSNNIILVIKTNERRERFTIVLRFSWPFKKEKYIYVYLYKKIIK